MAFFHIAARANSAELVGHLDHSNAEHAYALTVWAVGEVVQETVQLSSARLQAGSYAVWV